jgi:diacylglycerol kinase (ATP)
MHFYLLENPAAGRGKARAFLDGVTRALVAAGQRVTTYGGRSAPDVVAHVNTLGAGDLDVLVVVGGDGTLRTVVGARDGAPPWPVGVIPVGTANLVARELGTFPPTTPEALAARLQRGRAWTVDLLEMRRGEGPPERALAVVSIGVDGTLVHEVANARRRARGRGGYDKWLAPGLGVVRAFRPPPLEVQVDSAPPRTCAAVVIQNAHCYGGLFTLSPAARLDSGQAEVVLLDAQSPRDLVRLVVAAGLGRIHRDRQVKILRGARVRLRAPAPVHVQADGDPAGTTDVDVRVLPAAMRLWRTGDDPR